MTAIRLFLASKVAQNWRADLPASAGATHKVEDLVRLELRIRGSIVVDAFHDVLDDHNR
jgi:hypothetical protein